MALFVNPPGDMTSNERNAVPPQHTGIETNVTHTIECESNETANALFEKAAERLLDVSRWKELCGKASAAFQLTDTNGRPVFRPAQRGDKFQIDIPAPGTNAGGGHDWVAVEAITKASSDAENESVAMRVRPCANPTTSPLENDTAHFYTSEATSTFIVSRNAKTVSAEVHGRNEKPNTGEADNLLDKARNALVAIGAIAGLHKPQWKALVLGLLKQD